MAEDTKQELTYDQKVQIFMDLVLERPPTITGRLADEFRKELEIEIEEMRKKGIYPDPPFD